MNPPAPDSFSRSNPLKQLWVLMMTALIDQIGFLMIVPLLPYYAQRMGASPLVVARSSPPSPSPS